MLLLAAECEYESTYWMYSPLTEHDQMYYLRHASCACLAVIAGLVTATLQ